MMSSWTQAGLQPPLLRDSSELNAPRDLEAQDPFGDEYLHARAP